jgi:hypothetical protein
VFSASSGYGGEHAAAGKVARPEADIAKKVREPVDDAHEWLHPTLLYSIPF